MRTYQMPEPSALALDRRRHLLIVASGSTAQLRILDSVSGRPRTLLPLDAPPVAVGVDERRDRTVVLERSAFGRDGFVALLATSTGRVLASYTVALNADSLATVLLRKTDWHHYEGIRLLLKHGVDPDRVTQWGKTALHNAVLSDNRIEIIEILLDHGANPLLTTPRPHRRQSPETRLRRRAEANERRGPGKITEMSGPAEQSPEAARSQCLILRRALDPSRRCVG